MSHDQCPTTVKGEKQQPSKRHLAATPRKLQRINGQAAWRSMDELVDAPEFREHLEREFPAAMAELVTREAVDLQAAEQIALAEPAKKHDSRREFLKLMGASMALAGVAATVPGCRRPDHKIYTYSKVVPEEIIPGKPLYYVTAMPRWDGGAEGLMVETHEGRPTKIEGNPLHPVNQGKASKWAMASIMSLYDPDRVRDCVFDNPARGKTAASFDDFRAWGSDHFKKYEGSGEGLAIIAEKSTSPTRAAVRDKLLKKYPKAKWCVYNAAQASGESEGTKLAFGKAMKPMFSMSKANTNVIVSLDRDFVEGESASLLNARQFASTRMLSKAADAMSRLYVVESSMTNTGGQADHRLRLAPSRVTAFAVLLAQRVMKNLAGADFAEVKSAVDGLAAGAGNAMGADIDPVFLDECAKDLLDSANRGKSLVMAGPSQPAIVHAIVAALNAGLDNVGKSVSYLAVDEESVAGGQQVSLAELAKHMNDGKISTLVCVNVNPAYDAPGDLKFVDGWKKVGATITLTVGQSETAAASTWAVSGAHYLESWGDVRSIDGTLSPVQPMIAPLYETSMSEIEFLALLAAKDFGAKVDGYELVRETWKSNAAAWFGAGEFETKWRRALHNGVVENTAKKSDEAKFNGKAVADAIAGLKLAAAPSSTSLDVVFTVGNMADGRFANVGWLQELPHAATRVVWDNPVVLSPKTAEELGLSPEGFEMGAMDDDTNKMNGMYTKPKYPTAKVAELTLGGRTIKCPVWICPGTPDNTAVMMVGYGRTNAGVVGDEVGVNVYPLMNSGGVGGGMSASGLSLKDTGDTHMICSTQNHWTLDGKDSIIRAVDLPAWKKYGDDVQKVVDSFYGTVGPRDLNFAEKLGELTHVPPNLSIYKNPYNKSNAEPAQDQVEPGDPNGPKYQQNVGPAYASRPQWAMTIDQQTCTGCGACTIACQSENNIPVVGKKETAKGRELAWIRVDRYFTGNDFNNPSAMHQQPVACVHCENAPCEVVCPVSATVHGPEGINYMTYNRCIGTRYCANNCPYKVRRYNWFDYGVTKFNGGYYFKDLVDPIGEHIPGQEGITGSQKHNSINPNLIPPRLRQKLDEISKMQKNPDVTVRSRGVMEKCSYCIQRINFAKIECKLADIRDSEGKHVIPDGFFQSACQQACPSNAITFGDELDKTSKVHATRHNARSYALLGYLNTRPRTSHMIRVMNPNPEILRQRDPDRFKNLAEPFHHGGHDDHDHGHDHGSEKAGSGGGHSFFDTRKRREDSGYAMSLRVLSTNNAGGVRA